MSVKMIFKATASCKALLPGWTDGAVGEVETLESKRILKDYPDNFAVFDHGKHHVAASAEDGDDSQGRDNHGGGHAIEPIALEDALTDDDDLLNTLLDNGVTSLSEAQQLTNGDLKSMGVADRADRKAALKLLKELEVKPDSDKSEGAPDSTK